MHPRHREAGLPRSRVRGTVYGFPRSRSRLPSRRLCSSASPVAELAKASRGAPWLQAELRSAAASQGAPHALQGPLQVSGFHRGERCGAISGGTDSEDSRSSERHGNAARPPQPELTAGPGTAALQLPLPLPAGPGLRRLTQRAGQQ